MKCWDIPITICLCGIMLYLDWFEKDKRFKGKKVYGIICLNSPTQQLIDKVHADKRMRLFEYQISYTEL